MVFLWFSFHLVHFQVAKYKQAFLRAKDWLLYNFKQNVSMLLKCKKYQLQHAGTPKYMAIVMIWQFLKTMKNIYNKISYFLTVDDITIIPFSYYLFYKQNAI